jgi:YHS domain-containing protein
MFVDLEFNAKAPAGLSIPQDAVLDSGLQKIVYVETSDDVFEPRPVKIGTAYGDRVEIVHGLEEGDRIVTSGNFLVDSESRIRSAKVVSNSTKTELAANRDPVCGMPLDAKHAHDSSYTAKYQGETFSFCSQKCQKQFEQDPAKYAGEKVGSAALLAGRSRRGDD